jgi:hypothetical protein
LVAGASWLGYYDARVNGNPLKLPYTINRSTYAVAPYWIWQSPRPEPAYHHEVMRDFYARAELNDFLKGHSPRGFLIQIFGKILLAVLFFGGLALLPGAIMIRRVWHDKRTRFLVICLLVMAAGTLFESFFFPYYIAPFTAAITALGVQALRHLNQWKPGGKPIGSAMVRLSVALCIGMAALRLWAELAHWQHPSSPGSAWGCECYTPSQFNTSRARLEEKLEHMPGRQLVIVRYTPHHEPMKEWVYNEPDIENSKVLWAREMDTAKNLELIHFYPNRQVWLVEPDTQPDAISPYRAASP